MKIFVTDARVAQALARDTHWQPTRLEGYSHDAFGCVVAGAQGVDGVLAECDDCTALDAYYGLFSGEWGNVLEPHRNPG